MTNDNRPLSPHLSIYRWPITMATSILHRATGVALAVGFILFVAWLFDAASGPDSYALFVGAMESTVGCVLLVGWSFAFFYHLSNGVRHLVSDTGRGLEKGAATALAWLVVVAAILLTVTFWWLAS